MAQTLLRLGGLGVLLAPLFKALQRKQEDKVANLVSKVLSGTATPQEISEFALKYPTTFQRLTSGYNNLIRAQNQALLNKLSGEVKEKLTPRPDYTAWKPQMTQLPYTGLLQQETPQIPTAKEMAQIPKEYPSEKDIRIYGSLISILQGHPERTVGFAVPEILPESVKQYNLARANYWEESSKLRQQQATNEYLQGISILYDISKKRQATPYEIELLKQKVKNLDAIINREKAQADYYKNLGRRAEADAIEQEIINEYLPRKLKLQNLALEAGIDLTKEKTKQQNQRTTEQSLTPYQRLTQQKKDKLAIEALRLGKYVYTDKLTGQVSTEDIADYQTALGVIRMYGANPDNPEIKRLLIEKYGLPTLTPITPITPTTPPKDANEFLKKYRLK